MAKAKKERAKEYEKPVPVKGSFLEVMKAAVKDANKRSKAKQTEIEKKIDDINSIKEKRRGER